MRRGLFISFVFHVTITIIAYFGVPYLNPEPLISDTPIFVDLVNAADKSNPPPPQPVPEPKVKKIRELVDLPPEPAAKLEPEVAAKREFEVAELPPEPKPSLEPEPKIQKKVNVRPKPQPKPKLVNKLARIRPPKKPRAPDAFESVLKTLEAMDKAKPKQRRKTEKKENGETAFEEAIAVALSSNTEQSYNPKIPVSMSETDAIRKHFQRCWNVPSGAKGARGMVVELEIHFLQDGSVRTVKVLNSARMRMDSFFKITAEAAQRAVLHPKCNKLSMPSDKFPNWQSKYLEWQKMTLVFDPKDMF